MAELTPSDFWTLEETERVFKVIKDRRDRAIFAVAYFHGLRASEIALIRKEDIDLKRRRIYCRRLKGSIDSEQILCDAEIKLLRPVMARAESPDSPVFLSRNGNGISRKRLDQLVKEYGAKAGLPPSKRHFHAIKHSFATHLVSGGAELGLAQDLLGHKCVESTRVYARLTSGSRDRFHRNILNSSVLAKVR